MMDNMNGKDWKGNKRTNKERMRGIDKEWIGVKEGKWQGKKD